MRNEQQMYQMILETAKQDERILAVYMNGSRTNENAKKDIFQDYDIVYVVKETKSFQQDREWINRFGEILYMQYPEETPYYPSDKDNSYGWLIQFRDGCRMDLHVETVEITKKNIYEDKLCKILLDKQGILPVIPKASDQDHWVVKPTKAQYLATCNEFWWCTNNIAKGLWRKEITYVQDMTNYVVRKQLERVLSWKVGIATDFKVSIGKSGKYLYRWLEKEEWECYLSTYFGADCEEAWNAVLRMCDLFSKTAQYVGNCLGYEYNQTEGKNAREYLEHVRKLPKEARGVYEDK